MSKGEICFTLVYLFTSCIQGSICFSLPVYIMHTRSISFSLPVYIMHIGEFGLHVHNAYRGEIDLV
jgi:hypothetical protein